MSNGKCTIRVKPDEDGVYIAWIEQLPGCVDQGETLFEAVQNVINAMNFTLDSMLEEGEPIPEKLRFLRRR